jgi:hypothetical protein
MYGAEESQMQMDGALTGSSYTEGVIDRLGAALVDGTWSLVTRTWLTASTERAAWDDGGPITP